MLTAACDAWFKQILVSSRTLFVLRGLDLVFPSIGLTFRDVQDDLEDHRKKRLDEPQEEADAVECDVPADECEVAMTERDGTATESEASLRDEIAEAFQPAPSVLIESPEDGLPMPADERGSLAVAHPFTRETVICVEDDTVFVELFEEELAERGWVQTSHGYKPHMNGGAECEAHSKYTGDGSNEERRSFSPDVVEFQYGKHVAFTEDGKCVPVRARRERCINFMRQVMANDDVPNPNEPGHFLRFYNCAARKSVGGALMSLRDEAVYACDYRSPVDTESTERYLDKFDRDRLNSKRHLELIRPFALDE